MNPVTLFGLGMAFLVVMSLMGCAAPPCARGCMSATVEREAQDSHHQSAP